MPPRTDNPNHAYAEFLDHPGLPGACGALMDEYARAAIDLCAVIEAFDTARFTTERPGVEAWTASPRAICLHVIRAAHGYADDIRKARNLAFKARLNLPPETLPTPAAFRPLLAGALRYTEGALAGLYEASEDEVAAIKFTVSWGVAYDPDMLLEHAVCHLLRHRRQLERW
jgi:hypothetical protein